MLLLRARFQPERKPHGQGHNREKIYEFDDAAMGASFQPEARLRQQDDNLKT